VLKSKSSCDYKCYSLNLTQKSGFKSVLSIPLTSCKTASLLGTDLLNWERLVTMVRVCPPYGARRKLDMVLDYFEPRHGEDLGYAEPYFRDLYCICAGKNWNRMAQMYNTCGSVAELVEKGRQVIFHL
jgi:hypothetical protein